MHNSTTFINPIKFNNCPVLLLTHDIIPWIIRYGYINDSEKMAELRVLADSDLIYRTALSLLTDTTRFEQALDNPKSDERICLERENFFSMRKAAKILQQEDINVRTVNNFVGSKQQIDNKWRANTNIPLPQLNPSAYIPFTKSNNDMDRDTIVSYFIKTIGHMIPKSSDIINSIVYVKGEGMDDKIRTDDKVHAIALKYDCTPECSPNKNMTDANSTNEQSSDTITLYQILSLCQLSEDPIQIDIHGTQLTTLNVYACDAIKILNERVLNGRINFIVTTPEKHIKLSVQLDD